MRKIFLGLSILMLGCNIATTYKNNNIDIEIKAKIKIQNDKLIDAINHTDLSKIFELFSDTLQKKIGTHLAEFIELCHKNIHSKSYSVLNEFYSKNQNVGQITQVITGISEENDYSIDYQALNKDTYISLLLINEKNYQSLITCIYGKYRDEWKLNVFRLGQYSVFGKNAIDFYKQAKENYIKGRLIDAVIDISSIQQTVKPAENYFNYQQEPAMKEFAKKVLTEVNNKYPLPMNISRIKTNPQIFKITSKPTNEGIYPSLAYISKISLKDTIALKNENIELQKIIGEVFSGINKSKKYIFYTAYNEIQNGQTDMNSHEFIQKIN